MKMKKKKLNEMKHLQKQNRPGVVKAGAFLPVLFSYFSGENVSFFFPEK